MNNFIENDSYFICFAGAKYRKFGSFSKYFLGMVQPFAQIVGGCLPPTLVTRIYFFGGNNSISLTCVALGTASLADS